jgi:hypothetical protein
MAGVSILDFLAFSGAISVIFETFDHIFQLNSVMLFLGSALHVKLMFPQIHTSPGELPRLKFQISLLAFSVGHPPSF